MDSVLPSKFKASMALFKVTSTVCVPRSTRGESISTEVDPISCIVGSVKAKVPSTMFPIVAEFERINSAVPILEASKLIP